MTGAALVVFIVFHFIANLALFSPNPKTYNSISNSLVDLGGWLVFAEIVLCGLLAIHILIALNLKLVSMRARPHGYEFKQTKGGPSKLGFASTKLFLTGAVILIFLIVHIIQFKFGPGLSEGYSVSIQGKMVRDLHRLVLETFHKGYWMAFYVICMIFLGFHLRHGIWSQFQSLGATNKRTTGPIYNIGTALAVIIAVGFALMPIFIALSGNE